MKMTEQERKFADECVFQFFHGDTVENASVGAAERAGYEMPVDVIKAENMAKSLLGKTEIRAYIDAEIERFREIFSDGQRKNLWNYISAFDLGEAETGTLYGAIRMH